MTVHRPPVTAKDVQIMYSHTAVCRIRGCGWTGLPWPTYQEANTERQDHLRLHQAARDAVRDE